jgi:hypothetical protein
MNTTAFQMWLVLGNTGLMERSIGFENEDNLESIQDRTELVHSALLTVSLWNAY